MTEHTPEAQVRTEAWSLAVRQGALPDEQYAFYRGFDAGRSSMVETVTSVEELDALPVGSIVMVANGDVWKTHGGGYIQVPANDPDWMAVASARHFPGRVLFRPDREEGKG